jgi:trans-aconitate methyltransferase
MRLLAAVLFSALACCAQDNYPVSEEQIKAALAGVAQHTERIEPMLRQLDPKSWVAKGAPDTYVTQWNTALSEIGSIRIDMQNLGQKPDQVSEGLKALIRIGAWHQVMRSLMGGLRQYQNPALADLIESVAAEDQADVDRVQQYLVELATEREKQFQLVNEEAQRCRGILSRQPATPPRPGAR